MLYIFIFVLYKKDAMYSFIFDIYHSYHNANPYHNFKHALDVLQSTWYYLRSLGLFFKSIVDTKNPLKLLLKPVHILALLIASLGHDVGHPGVNNGFLVNNVLHRKLYFIYLSFR